VKSCWLTGLPFPPRCQVCCLQCCGRSFPPSPPSFSPPPPSPHLVLLRRTPLGLVRCLCSGLCVPRWQCVRVQRDTKGLGRAAGFQVLLWCLAALGLRLTKSSPPHWVCALVSPPALLRSREKPSCRLQHRRRRKTGTQEQCSCF